MHFFHMVSILVVALQTIPNVPVFLSNPRRRLCAGGFTRLGLLLLFSHSVVSDSV